VTHEAIRPLLADYAAGTLDAAGCEAVRVHLAEGCVACLAEVFDRPVGLPRTPASPPAPMPGSLAHVRRGFRVLAAGLGLALAALGVRAISELRSRQADTAERLSELETQRGALSARVATLEHDVEVARRQLEAARAEASGLAQTVRATAEADAEQRRRLEAIEARATRLARTLAARQREIGRLRAEADARGTLAALLGAPGLEVLPLAPVAPFHDVRGHVLWRPTHDSVLLYASGLPRLPAGSTYQVHLAFDEGGEQAGPSFRPDGDGALALAIPLGRAAERLRVVRVLLEPAAEPVLAGSRSRD
jgi:outer membrane murein-binding lipoprotein Lpp